MSRLDPFTHRRLLKFIPDFRAKTGQLPTRRDLEEAGFGLTVIDAAIRDRIIEMFYVTLTSGSIVKVFKISQDID